MEPAGPPGALRGLLPLDRRPGRGLVVSCRAAELAISGVPGVGDRDLLSPGEIGVGQRQRPGVGEPGERLSQIIRGEDVAVEVVAVLGGSRHRRARG
ncbi:MAG: hypothetical protein ACRDRX_00645 [Pseudonocardiaceae bacterium]